MERAFGKDTLKTTEESNATSQSCNDDYSQQNNQQIYPKNPKHRFDGQIEFSPQSPRSTSYLADPSEISCSFTLKKKTVPKKRVNVSGKRDVVVGLQREDMTSGEISNDDDTDLCVVDAPVDCVEDDKKEIACKIIDRYGKDVAVVPTPDDVLCGQNTRQFEGNNGNVRYRNLILSKLDQYSQVISCKPSKMMLTKKIVQRMKNKYNARFLLLQKTTTTISIQKHCALEANSIESLKEEEVGPLPATPTSTNRINQFGSNKRRRHRKLDCSDNSTVQYKWRVLSDAEARDKTSHAIRFALLGRINSNKESSQNDDIRKPISIGDNIEKETYSIGSTDTRSTSFVNLTDFNQPIMPLDLHQTLTDIQKETFVHSTCNDNYMNDNNSNANTNYLCSNLCGSCNISNTDNHFARQQIETTVHAVVPLSTKTSLFSSTLSTTSIPFSVSSAGAEKDDVPVDNERKTTFHDKIDDGHDIPLDTNPSVSHLLTIPETVESSTFPINEANYPFRYSTIPTMLEPPMYASEMVLSNTPSDPFDSKAPTAMMLVMNDKLQLSQSTTQNTNEGEAYENKANDGEVGDAGSSVNTLSSLLNSGLALLLLLKSPSPPVQPPPDSCTPDIPMSSSTSLASLVTSSSGYNDSLLNSCHLGPNLETSNARTTGTTACPKDPATEVFSTNQTMKSSPQPPPDTLLQERYDGDNGYNNSKDLAELLDNSTEFCFATIKDNEGIARESRFSINMDKCTIGTEKSIIDNKKNKKKVRPHTSNMKLMNSSVEEVAGDDVSTDNSCDLSLSDTIANVSKNACIMTSNEHLIQTTDPTDADVLFGRGKLVYRHPGNVRFLEARTKLQSKYRSAEMSKQEKFRMSQQLVDQVHNWGGRFLKYSHCTHAIRKNALATQGGWYEVSNDIARKKASQTLRENTLRRHERPRPLYYSLQLSP